MKKRILSLVLATLLIAAMAIPASAAQYVSDGYYGGSYYEIVDNCTYDMYSGVEGYTGTEGHRKIKQEAVANMVGEILTVQEAAGFQLNIAKWDEEFIRLWNTPCHTPAYSKE